MQLPNLLLPFDFLKKDKDSVLNDKIEYINFFEGDVEINGSIIISADNMIVPKEGIVITNSSWIPKIQSPYKLLAIISNGTIDFTIFTSHFHIQGSSEEGYIIFAFEKGAEVNLNVPDNHRLTMITLFNNSITCLSLSGNLTFKVAPNSVIMLKNVTILARGEAYFDKLLYYSFKEDFPYLVKYYKKVIKGSIEMHISIVDNNIFVIDTLTISNNV